ncbi:GntR family transcriptional regulator [Providencia sp. PROV110]|uniref:GntR family transcriptional regulator n=1 Tax=Providencia sp. PROV110 TaxID=2949821 RepID=UPI001E0B383D|nr:GntR family transcriptional regulator [Providencia sp. PROV110]EIU9516064.1 GntR family transcriptional regulator [Providencia rettgeri]ELR5097414.1 GntR family transcriptional regulator [Providencia rettgeri]
MIDENKNRPFDTPSKDDYWQPIKARTLTDDVVDKIVEAATRGYILPGDRIVEKEIAEKMNVSRVPVREALRILESQCIVINEPFKGIRMAPVSEERLDELIEVRVLLELHVIRKFITGKKHLDNQCIEKLKECIDKMTMAAKLEDSYLFSLSDVNFHRTLCELSGNKTLTSLWENVSKQLTIIIGISTFTKPMEEIIQEHKVLLDKICAGDLPVLEKEIKEHIYNQNKKINFNLAVDKKRDK